MGNPIYSYITNVFKILIQSTSKLLQIPNLSGKSVHSASNSVNLTNRDFWDYTNRGCLVVHHYIICIWFHNIMYVFSLQILECLPILFYLTIYLLKLCSLVLIQALFMTYSYFVHFWICKMDINLKIRIYCST